MSHAPSVPFKMSNTIRVLLVDDQEIIGKAVELMLKGEPDLEFLHVTNPVEAIPTAIGFKPTIILQDLIMPEVDGLTLVKFYRAHPATKEVPIVVLSAREEPVTKAKAFEVGANDYIVKLPDRLELLARVRYHSSGYRHLLERNDAYQQIEASRKTMAYQIQSALKYVQSLLPQPMDTPVRARWNYLPCTSLGGDTFNYYMLDDDNMAIFLLDVTGHGLDSAFLSVSVMNVLRSRSLDANFLDPASVTDGLNKAFPMENYGDKSFTIWYGVYSFSKREIAWSGGGHPPSILMCPGREIELLDSDGPIIGIMPWDEFVTSRRPVAPGSRLFVYSDGCHEIHLADGREWTFAEFLDVVKQNRDLESSEFLTRLLAICRSLAGTDVLDDDFTATILDFPR